MEGHLSELEARIAVLQRVVRTLVEHQHGDAALVRALNDVGLKCTNLPGKAADLQRAFVDATGITPVPM